MSHLVAIFGGIMGLVFGTLLHSMYVAPSIKGVAGILVSGILTLAMIILFSYTGFNWDNTSRTPISSVNETGQLVPQSD
jgi:hypothetical protein